MQLNNERENSVINGICWLWLMCWTHHENSTVMLEEESG